MPSHIFCSSDKGLDCVYVLQDDGEASFFGKHGKGDLEFRGLNSLVVDDAGNMIVSDGLQQKLRLVSKHNEYLGLVKVKTIILSCSSFVVLVNVYVCG